MAILPAKIFEKAVMAKIFIAMIIKNIFLFPLYAYFN